MDTEQILIIMTIAMWVVSMSILLIKSNMYKDELEKIKVKALDMKNQIHELKNLNESYSNQCQKLLNRLCSALDENEKLKKELLDPNYLHYGSR